jgi:hypothetical protein
LLQINALRRLRRLASHSNIFAARRSRPFNFRFTIADLRFGNGAPSSQPSPPMGAKGSGAAKCGLGTGEGKIILWQNHSAIHGSALVTRIDQSLVISSPTYELKGGRTFRRDGVSTRGWSPYLGKGRSMPKLDCRHGGRRSGNRTARRSGFPGFRGDWVLKGGNFSGYFRLFHL